MIEQQLLILRHAKSDWGSPDISDSDRPLNKRGERAAIQMGQWIKKQNLPIDLMLSSPALRAQQTVECVYKVIETEKPIQWEPKLYLASLNTLLKILTPALKQAGRVMVVGHNPGLEELLIYLCGNEALPRTEDGKLLTTANLAQVMLPGGNDPLQAGVGQLANLWRPKEIEQYG